MVAGRVTASVVQRQVKYIRPVPVASASGLVAQVYAQGAEETRIVTPPMLLHSPAPDVLAAYWMLVRGSGCVERGPRDLVRLLVRRPGELRLEIRFALGRLLSRGARCYD